MLESLFALFAQSASAAMVQPPPAAPQIPTGAALRAEIHAVDAEFFRLMWKDCETPEKLAAFLHPDGEFYHDVNGYRKSPPAVVAFQKRRCSDEKAKGWSHRRELVETSFYVDPVPRFGAIATGEHRFYRKEKGKPETLIAAARFLTVYKREADGWKGYRTISYAHRPK